MISQEILTHGLWFRAADGTSGLVHRWTSGGLEVLQAVLQELLKGSSVGLHQAAWAS